MGRLQLQKGAMGRVTRYGAPLSSAGPRSKQAIASPSHWLAMGPSPSCGAGEGLSIAPERQRTYVLLVEGAGRRAMTEGVQIREVGMRDGLQSIAEIMPTETKLAWLDAEYAAGVREIEVSSFVPPKLLPQLADAEAVVQHALTLPGLTASSSPIRSVTGTRRRSAGYSAALSPMSRRSRWRRISTTRAGSGSPMCWPPSPPVARRSTPRWAGSAAALMRLERPATSSSKTPYSCSSRWGWRRASIWTSSPKRATSWRALCPR